MYIMKEYFGKHRLWVSLKHLFTYQQMNDILHWFNWMILSSKRLPTGRYITLCWGTVLPTPLFSWFLCMLWNSFQGFPLLWPTTTKSSNPWIICYFLTHCSYYYLVNYLNKTEYSNLSQLLHYQQNAKNMYYTIYIWKCFLFSLSY